MFGEAGTIEATKIVATVRWFKKAGLLADVGMFKAGRFVEAIRIVEATRNV